MSIRKHAWYLKPVEKSRHSWTDAEVDGVYTMRTGGQSFGTIIKSLKLRVKKTQVYNIFRIRKKNLENKCFQCGDPLTPADLASGHRFKRCGRCNGKLDERKAGERALHLKKGVCGCCHHNPVIPGKTYCKGCLSATYRRRVKTGICGICGKLPIDRTGSQALCKPCLKKNRVNSMEYRYRKGISCR